MTDDEIAALKAEAEGAQACLAEYLHWNCEPSTVLSLLARLERAEAALRDLLPLAEAAHDAAMSEAGHTGKPWPEEIRAARAALEPGA